MTTSKASGAPSDQLLDDGERLGYNELKDLQFSRLKNTLQTAYDKVGHYRKAFDSLGVTPDDLTSLSDLSKFPTTGKEELRENYPFGMFAVGRDQVARIHASSGTTGQATVVGYTLRDLDTWAALIGRCFRAAGSQPGQLVHNAYGYGLFTGGLGLGGAERCGYTVVPVSGGQTARQIQLIQDFRPDVISCTPTYLLTIIDEFEHRGIDPATTSLQTAVCGAEPWTDGMRDELESKLDVDAVDIYGLSEVMGPGVAMEFASTKDGLTVWEDHFYPEIIDPDTSEPVDDGQEGELVFTSLTKEALPIIRYRTHDLAKLLPGTARPNFRRMSRITGRTDDLVIIRGVNVFPTQVEEVLLTMDGLSPHFQLILTRPGRMDEMTVQIEARPDLATDRWEELEDRTAHLLKERLGVTATVVVTAPDTLERSVGKLKRIIDRRDKS